MACRGFIQYFTSLMSLILFIQLSIDHTITTNAELQRLANLGLDIEKLQYSGYLDTTRSIGDWEFKGGYKNNEILRYYGLQLNLTLFFLILHL